MCLLAEVGGRLLGARTAADSPASPSAAPDAACCAAAGSLARRARARCVIRTGRIASRAHTADLAQSPSHMRRGASLLPWLSTTILAVLLLAVDPASAYSSGAPPSVCSSMTPAHPGSPQSQATSPYAVYVSAGQYSPGGQLTVTINGTRPFKGFLLIARTSSSSSAVGSFAVDAVSKQACVGGLTHKSSIALSNLAVQWTPPATVQGPVNMFATVVHNESIYWVGLSSALVWDGQSLTGPTTAASVRGGSVVTLTKIGAGCGTTASCFSSPSGCTGSDCNYLLVWRPVLASAPASSNSSGLLQFQLQGRTTVTPGYVSVGFGKSKTMKGLSVVNCVSTSAGVKVTQTYSNGNEEPSFLTAASNLQNTSGAVTNGVIQCSFIWNNNARSSSEQFDLSQPYYIVMARGQAVANPQGNIMQHRDNPVSYSNLLVVASAKYTDYSAGASSALWLKKVHGAFMTLAWVLCGTVSVILARFYKKQWLSTKLCGEKVWFAWHRALALICTSLTIIAFVLIYIAVGGWSELNEPLFNAHAYLGVIVTALAIANPIMGFFRCNPGTKNRNIFNWAHWVVGNLALVLSGATLLIGYQINVVTVCPPWLVYLAAAFVVWFGVAYFGLMAEEIVTTRQVNLASSLTENGNNVQMKSAAEDAAAASSWSGWNQDLFKGAFFVVNLILTLAIALILTIAVLAF